MNLFKILYLLFLIYFVKNCFALEAVRTDWKIKTGDCQDCIKIPVDEPSNYDFAVYKDKLFISDYQANQIRVFDKVNHNVKNIKLTGIPEIITIYEDKLYILLKDSSLGIYDLILDSLTTQRLKDKFTENELSGAFFLDNLLAIPLIKDLIAVKSDAKVFDITQPKYGDKIYGLFDFASSINIPADSSFKHRPSKLIDLCGGNGTYLILQRFESAKTFNISGYILVNRKDRSIRKLDPIPDNYGTLIHSNAGRGMKIINDRIYFISELIGEGENTIIIGSISII